VTPRRERLWLALRFPDLPLTALQTSNSTGSAQQDLFSHPAVVVEKQQVVYATATAREAGIGSDMDMTTARLLCDCQFLPRNPAAEEKALGKLCEQLYRFTPHLETYQSNASSESGVLLEISTCLQLFGGVQKLCQSVFTFLTEIGQTFIWGLGHTSKGAWLLSFAPPLTVAQLNGDNLTSNSFIQRLHQLPIEVLADYPQAVEALSSMGFSTLEDIGRQINAQSVASFGKRLGKAFGQALQDIYGIDQRLDQSSLFSKPVVSYTPEDVFVEELQFDYPVIQVDHLRPGIEDLLQQLAQFLRTRQLETQHIQWRISDIYRSERLFHVYCDNGQDDWQLFYDLSLIQFENTPLPFEVDCLELSCKDLMPLQGREQDLELFSKRPGGSSRELAVTLAKLKARVGENAIHKVSYNDSPLPELSHAIVGLAEKCHQSLADGHRQSLRPSWLFVQPQPIEERGQRLFWRGYLTLAAGPERIVGQWWSQSVARDYYLARRHDNVPVWAFQDLYSKQWYVHGVFS